MTRQDKIKLLATEVMGWGVTEFGNWRVDPLDDRSKIIGSVNFNPYANSADNDAMIEAFVGKSRISMEIGFCERYDEIDVTIWEHEKCGDEITVIAKGAYTTAKKNEAVCEAIIQAVSK